MRVVFDLSSCQAESSGARVADVAEAMLRACGDHDFHVAVDAGKMASAESLRRRFRTHLLPAHFHSIVVPERGALSIDEKAYFGIAAALKNMALQGLLADVLLIANPRVDSFGVHWADSERQGHLRVCLLIEPFPVAGAEAHAMLRTFDLILAAGDAVYRRVVETTVNTEDRLIDIGNDFDASIVWKLITHASACSANDKNSLDAKSLRMAVVSPAALGERNVATLQRHLPDQAAIDLFVEDDMAAGPQCHVCSLTELPARSTDYDAVFYYMANDPAYAFMLPMIEQIAGILVLDDGHLDGTFSGLGPTLDSPQLITREALYCDGVQSLLAERNAARPSSLTRRLIELSDGVMTTADIATTITESKSVGSWLPTIVVGSMSDGISATHVANASRRRDAFQQLADALKSIKPDGALLGVIARHAATNANSRRQPRLLVDVTQLATSNARSGIQRVVRNIARELGDATQLDRPFELVQLFGGKLWRSTSIVASIFELDVAGIPEQEISIQPGDTLLMLDSSWEQYLDFKPVFQMVRQMGGTIVTVVYDLIPLLMPDLCSPGLTAIFQNWFRLAVDQSDQLICISRAVADEVATHLRERGLAQQVAVGHWRLGADIAITSDESMVRPEVHALIADRRSPMFLMVGTIEPRKGHDFALDAFELLWQGGSDARLCIAGSIGWMVTDTVKRIRQHPELNRRLFFIEQFTDAEIAMCYQVSAALIAASVAEGFGLPIVEAAMHGVAVIASDIPVFREVGGDGARYFSRVDARFLADAVRDFLSEGRGERDVARVKVVTWRESAELLLAAIGCSRI